MIHQKIAYQNFMLYEKSVTCHQCHSGIHMDKLQVVYLCVCIHMHVEFFACKHRFIIMLMPLNDIKCCVCHKNWWGKESTCTSLFHKYAYVLNLPMFCNWKYFEYQSAKFFTTKISVMRYSLQIHTVTYTHLHTCSRVRVIIHNAYIFSHCRKCIMQVLMYMPIYWSTQKVSEFDYVGLMAYLPYKWCI